MIRPLLLAGVLVCPLAADEPIRLATHGRLWLKTPPGQAPLRDVSVSCGSAGRADWESDPAARQRHVDVVFPIHWWRWSEVTVTFTPAADGPVEWVLCGPWAKDANDALFRQEILWDDLSAHGAQLTNGGFEAVANNTPAAWQTPRGTYPPTTAWPLAHATPRSGKHLAATWHNRPLSQSLATRNGQTVRLRLHAMAATPPGFMPPQRLPDNTPAHQAAARLKRGVNLGNGWEADPGASWSMKFTPEDIDRIADQGFDHVRVPVAWHFHLTDTPRHAAIAPELLEKLEPVLRRAMERDLHVLLNWHHFNDLTNDPAANEGRFIRGWQAIARRFQSWPPKLMFELLNEPMGALTTATANPLYQKTITAIRATQPRRILVVSPGQWGQVGELDHLRLPDDDDRLVVTLHCYEPFAFTHQGANWVGYQDLRGIVYPGPPATPYQLPPSLRDNVSLRGFVAGYNSLPAQRNPCSPAAVRQMLDTARAWSKTFGRPVHLGEFGSHQVADDASRARYLRDVRTLAEARRIPWTLWEWKAGFGYWNPQTNQARFRKALFD